MDNWPLDSFRRVTSVLPAKQRKPNIVHSLTKQFARRVESSAYKYCVYIRRCAAVAETIAINRRRTAPLLSERSQPRRSDSRNLIRRNLKKADIALHRNDPHLRAT